MFKNTEHYVCTMHMIVIFYFRKRKKSRFLGSVVYHGPKMCLCHMTNQKHDQS